MTDPSQPADPTPAAAPPVSATYPVYGDTGAEPSAQPDQHSADGSPQVGAGSAPVRRFASYNAATSRSGGGLAVFVVIATIMVVVFAVVALLMFGAIAGQDDFEGPTFDGPTEIVEDPEMPGSVG